ncbi:TetR family transcriptional regulator [Paenibacillus sp. LC231]|uniref:TetR/AcrR family transcriptional regulator n=1 Tax=Paenibacillus sp. LC231 TaxID=1120679 RepID=UPI0008DD3C4B|nr:TetR/AcrR family transcriptional regulator [Paenibacillus sp. LC231]OIB01843.1 TetR family transcriptional regulator [Paenibacillus sp. LC231]
MKERIVAAASHEIKRRGLRFTMGDLAKRLGMSTKTLYGWFPSKDVLISTIFREAIIELQEKEKDIMNNPDLNTLDKLERCLILIPTDFQFIGLNLITELQRYYPDQWKTLDEFLNKQWDSITELFEEGINQGLLRPFNSKVFIDLYVGGLYRLIEDSSENKSSITLQESLRDMGEILLSGIIKKKV